MLLAENVVFSGNPKVLTEALCGIQKQSPPNCALHHIFGDSVVEQLTTNCSKS